MQKPTLYFVTHNAGKFREAQHLFQEHFDLRQIDMTYPELQEDDLSKIAAYGARYCAVELNKPVIVDVRIISATNHSLTKLIDQNKFREDLYFRIKGVNVTLPALRERPEDIPALVDHFLKEAAEEIGSKVSGITEAAMQILVAHDWPGNIRQLKNTVRTMVVMCDRDKLDVRDIPPDILKRRQLPGETPQAASNLAGVSLIDLEKKAILDTLARTAGNREQAAKILGIGECTLYRKIKEYGL
jgi:two-component system response regulator HydG